MFYRIFKLKRTPLWNIISLLLLFISVYATSKAEFQLFKILIFLALIVSLIPIIKILLKENPKDGYIYSAIVIDNNSNIYLLKEKINVITIALPIVLLFILITGDYTNALLFDYIVMIFPLFIDINDLFRILNENRLAKNEDSLIKLIQKGRNIFYNVSKVNSLKKENFKFKIDNNPKLVSLSFNYENYEELLLKLNYVSRETLEDKPEINNSNNPGEQNIFTQMPNITVPQEVPQTVTVPENNVLNSNNSNNSNNTSIANQEPNQNINSPVDNSNNSNNNNDVSRETSTNSSDIFNNFK